MQTANKIFFVINVAWAMVGIYLGYVVASPIAFAGGILNLAAAYILWRTF